MKYILFVIPVLSLLKLLDVFYPYSHGDALYYHLPIAKLWLEDGWRTMHQGLCGSLQGGLFDYFYVLPVGTFGANLWGQLAAQLLHFVAGLGFAIFISVKGLILTGALRWLAILFFLTISVDGDFLLYAKNDAILAAWGLLAALEFVEDIVSKKFPAKYHFIIKGFIIGMLPLIKINGIIIVIVLGLFHLIKHRQFMASIKIALVGGLVASPILIRNYYFLGSPFFPGLLDLFPGNLSEGMMSYYKASMTAKLTFHSLLFHLKAFFAFKIVFAVALCFYLKSFWRDKMLVTYFGISFAIFSCYLALNGGVIAARFYFVCFFINIYVLLKLWSQLKLNTLASVVLLVLILLDSKIDKSVKRNFNFWQKVLDLRDERSITRQFIPLTSMWDYIPENSTILSDDYTQIFHAKKNVRIFQYQCQKEINFLYQCESEDDVNKIQEFDFVILSDVKNTQNSCTNWVRSNLREIHHSGDYRLYQN